MHSIPSNTFKKKKRQTSDVTLNQYCYVEHVCQHVMARCLTGWEVAVSLLQNMIMIWIMPNAWTCANADLYSFSLFNEHVIACQRLISQVLVQVFILQHSTCLQWDRLPLHNNGSNALSIYPLPYSSEMKSLMHILEYSLTAANKGLRCDIRLCRTAEGYQDKIRGGQAMRLLAACLFFYWSFDDWKVQ